MDSYHGGSGSATTVVEQPHPYEGVPEPIDAGVDHGSEIHLPPASLWPITLAFGITVAMSGLVFNLWVSLAGGLIFVWAIRGWIQELMHSEH